MKSPGGDRSRRRGRRGGSAWRRSRPCRRARQRSRSPFMAWAVIAMIGSVASVARPRASRIAAVASKPSISGICTSIRTRSNRSRLSASTRLRCRSPATTTRGRPLPAAAPPDCWFTGLSSASRTCAAAARAAAIGMRRCAAALPRRGWSRAQGRDQIASSSSDWRDRLDQVARDAQLARSARDRRAGPADDSITIGRPRQLGLALDPLGHVEAVHVRHLASSSTSERLAASAAAEQLLSARLRRSDAGRRRIPQLASMLLRGCGGSSRCRRRPAPACRASIAAATCIAARPRRRAQPKRR